MKDKKTYSLRDLREKEGISISKLAVLTGIPYSTIQAIEIGRGKGFSITAKHILADHFHVPATKLFPEIKEQVAILLGTKRQLQMFVPKEELKKEK